MGSNPTEMQEPSIDTDKLSYEIFSILESKFLFGYDDQKLWIPKPITPPDTEAQPQAHVQVQPTTIDSSVSAIKNQRGKICILSIDGAGMRGILPGKALAYLEHALKVKSGNPDARIADYFDVAAGSGIGGIFTAMLFATKDQNRPIFKAEETWKFLAEQGKRFYRSSSGSGSNGSGFFRRLVRGCSSSSAGVSTAGLEKAMKAAFIENNRNLTLKDTLKPVLIPCYDLSSTAPFLFSRADALETDSFDFRLWEVCRATSAEPSLFEPVQMRSIDGQTRCVAVDGGLAMSNPTAAAITHVLHNKQEFPFVRGVEDLLVLSIGTGQLVEVNYDRDQIKNWRAKEWARPMARISGDGSAELVDQSVAMAFGQGRSSNYVRIQANGSSLRNQSGGQDLSAKLPLRKVEDLSLSPNNSFKSKSLRRRKRTTRRNRSTFHNFPQIREFGGMMDVPSSWDALRKQARKLEAQLDEQMNSYRKAVSTKVPAKNDTSEKDLESGIDRLLKQLQQVNSQMQAWVSSGGTEMVSHTLTRHQEILQDLTQEFYRLCSSLRAKKEHASLLEDFREFDRTRLDLEEGVGSGEQALLKEHASISRNTGQMDTVISQAQATLGTLVIQRSTFSGINSKLSNVGSRLPTVNSILSAIKRKKSLDTIILSLVASVCTFLIFIYWLSK